MLHGLNVMRGKNSKRAWYIDAAEIWLEERMGKEVRLLFRGILKYVGMLAF
jgi:hypothetical protein